MKSNVVDFLKAIGMELTISNHIVSRSDKMDVIRSEFAMKGWKRDKLGRMRKGPLQLSFVLDRVVLKKWTKELGWHILQTAQLEPLYAKVLNL